MTLLALKKHKLTWSYPEHLATNSPQDIGDTLGDDSSKGTKLIGRQTERNNVPELGKLTPVLTKLQQTQNE